jgi:DNA invertase Pin-like site-specific DNA recombinase
LKSAKDRLWEEKRQAIRLLHAAGLKVSQISRVTSVSRPTVYAVIKGERAVKTVRNGVDNPLSPVESSEA